jgi:dienelactone hydrolase
VGVLLLGAAACSSGSTRAAVIPSTTTTIEVPRTVAEQRPFDITVRHETFVDASRATATPNDPAYSPKRSLVTDLYIPKSSSPLPLIMFSHGYHGDPAKFSELFTAWAKAGYIVAAPEFPLTSTRGKPYDILTDYVNQPADISFILNELLAGPLRAQIDTKRIGAAGLSLGGATTFGLVYNPCCRDTRLRAAAIFDAVRLPFSKPFEQNTVPVLIAHIDTDIAAPYEILRKAYADSAAPKWLLTFQTGVHPEAYENTPSPHDKTAIATSIDFFDLTLLDDDSATPDS